MSDDKIEYKLIEELIYELLQFDNLPEHIRKIVIKLDDLRQNKQRYREDR